MWQFHICRFYSFPLSVCTRETHSSRVNIAIQRIHEGNGIYSFPCCGERTRGLLKPIQLPEVIFFAATVAIGMARKHAAWKIPNTPQIMRLVCLIFLGFYVFNKEQLFASVTEERLDHSIKTFHVHNFILYLKITLGGARFALEESRKPMSSKKSM